MELLKRNWAFNQCGAFGHSWDLEGTKTADLGTRFSLRCMRCETVRTDTLGPRMNLVTRAYDYPEGYKYNGSKPSRNELREAVVIQTKKRKRSVRRMAS